MQLWPHITAVLSGATEPLSSSQVTERLAAWGTPFPAFRVNDCLMRHVRQKGLLHRDQLGRYQLAAQTGHRRTRRLGA